MPQEYIIKTVSQYNKTPIPKQDMRLLSEIAKDYQTVKNVIFERYSGIRTLPKLYPGYTVQNEMTASGLRQRLGLPSVYFYLAVYDALGSIKSGWTVLKKKILQNINNNENFSADDKHYLRFVIKMDKVFEAVLNGDEAVVTGEYKNAYETIRSKVDAGKLDRYLCRQVRKYHKPMVSKVDDGFTTAERAYRYADHGIYLTTKKKRCRVFVPLTDNNCYKSQLYIKLFEQDGNLEIKAPVRRKSEYHEDYTSEIGIALGMNAMLTTHEGHVYGAAFGEYQTEYAAWIRQQNILHSQNKDTGRKKYHARKNRYTEKLHSYVNHELNRFLAEEKPQRVYAVKLPKPKSHAGSRVINNTVSMWQRGYIKKRLAQKCAEQSVELIEVLGKDISRECSRCQAAGSKSKGIFRCDACGFSTDEKSNTAANVLRRGQEGKIVKSTR